MVSHHPLRIIPVNYSTEGGALDMTVSSAVHGSRIEIQVMEAGPGDGERIFHAHRAGTREQEMKVILVEGVNPL